MTELAAPAPGALVSFTFEGETVRVTAGGDPWFVLADVCKVLEIGNPSQAATRLDDDEKGVITNDTLGGPQKTSIISESGLYSLVLSSRKPEAKRFKKWVTAEVLPSIRKTGSYGIAAPAPMTREKRLAGAVLFPILESAPFCFARLIYWDNCYSRALYRDVILGILQRFQESVLLSRLRFLPPGAGHVLGLAALFALHVLRPASASPRSFRRPAPAAIAVGRPMVVRGGEVGRLALRRLPSTGPSFPLENPHGGDMTWVTADALRSEKRSANRKFAQWNRRTFWQFLARSAFFSFLFKR